MKENNPKILEESDIRKMMEKPNRGVNEKIFDMQMKGKVWEAHYILNKC